MDNDHACPVCATSGAVFFRLPEMPVFVGVQWDSLEEAVNAPRGDLELAFCSSCGFIWNVAFDPQRMAYSQQYDNSLHFSSVFQEYTRGVVKRLVDRHGLKDSDVIDIGCGKGDFLAMLCEATAGHGTGFDPSFEGERVQSSASERLTYIQDFYGEKYAAHQADLVTSRYVLEHIEDPVDFLCMIRRSIGDRSSTVVYFEVPDVSLILDDLSVWDIIYEHCAYFSVESLARAFARSGFEVLDVQQTYRNQFVGIDARPSEEKISSSGDRWGDVNELATRVASFQENFARRIEYWTDHMDRFRRENLSVAAWGAGAKAVGFLNMLRLDADRLPYVVDINPHKHGKRLGGTGQLIVSPGSLRESPPDVVIIMNPVYRDEIGAQLSDMGMAPEIMEAS